MSRPANPLRPQAVSHVLSGGAPKSFAITHGISATALYRMLCRAGLRRQFLTDDEWQLIRQRRSNLSAQPKY